MGTLLLCFLDDPFRYDETFHISWSGAKGYQDYFHYWYLTNHELRSIVLLSIMAYVVRKDRNVFWFVIVYICYDIYELLNYLYYGGKYFTNPQQQFRESCVTIGFFSTVIILFIKDKWKHRK